MSAPIAAATLSHLIGSIYDCAVDVGRWPAALDELRGALDFKNAALQVIALPTGTTVLAAVSGIEPPWLEQMQGFSDSEVTEPWGGAAKLLSYPPGEPAVLSQVNDRANWMANRYFAEWAAPQGINDVMAVVLARDAQTIGTLGMGRHASAGEIGAHEVDTALLLIPHFQRAVAIGRLLEMRSLASHGLAAALDLIAAGVVLVDRNLRIIHANQAAQGMLERGQPVRSDRGMFSVASPATAAALLLAVHRAVKNEAGLGRRGFGIPVPGRDGSACVLHVLPLQQGELRPGLAPAAEAAIFVASAAAPAPSSNEAFAALFDFTAAEVRVFEQIAAGLTPLETASQLGLSINTVRTHLQNLFSKSGTSRQADLVRLAASFAVPV